ncbi:MAG: CoA-binding protein, partial [Thermoprotei archaeon]
LVASITGGEESRSAIRELIEAGIPCYESPEDAAGALAAICAYYRSRKKARGRLLHVEGDRELVRKVLLRAAREGRSMLTPIESFEVAKAYGVPVVEAMLARDEEEAVKLAKALGYPVALAVETPDVSHKTEVGGILLGLRSDAEVRDAFHEVLRNVRSRAPGARILGVSIRKMMPRGMEVFVGARRDPVFGPLVGFGWGGVAIELLRDVSFRLAPLSSVDVEEMIEETKVGRLLRGYRGRSLDDEAVKKTIVAVASLMEDFSEIEEIDVNPMFVYERGAAAVDVKVYLRAEAR